MVAKTGNKLSNSSEALLEENIRLREQVKAQEQMLNQTTMYMVDVQSKLELSKKELEKYSISLEAIVEDRTQELHKVVKELEEEIAQRSQMQRSLEQANFELNTLFYRSSHDFRAPICSVKGLLNLLHASLNPSPEDEPYIKLIGDSLNKLDTLTNTLTKIAEIRQRELNLHPVNVREEIDSVLAEYKNRYANTKIYVDIDPSILIISDAELLFSALDKIVANSFFYSSIASTTHQEGAAVQLQADIKDNHIEIGILDNGAGIDNDILPNAFEMFYRGNIHSKGNGLGLYLAKLAIDKLGGLIHLNNITGGGLNVSLVIPIINKVQ